ncbi:MAG: hypothetical protein LBD37_07695 [Treponema sp.]|jgi:hypothetical protein|nr:hypothetical protein [Treponema sp.]
MGYGKNVWKRAGRLLAVLLILSAWCLGGCPADSGGGDGGDGGGGEIPEVLEVLVSPPVERVLTGKTKQFAAAVAVKAAADKGVRWSVTGALSPGTVITPEGGFLTVGEDETSTALKVTATALYDKSKTGRASVTVASVQSVSISPTSGTAFRGGAFPFTAAIEGAGEPPQGVAWSVDGGSGETKIVDGILFVAPQEPAANLIIRAVSTADSEKSAAVVVAVSSETVTVDKVALYPSAARLPLGGSQTFAAQVSGTRNPSQTVVWSVEGANHPGTSVTSEGVLRVDEHETAASLTVKAFSLADPAKSATAAVTVAGAGGNSAVISGVVVIPSAWFVPQGGQTLCTALVLGTGTVSQAVRWSIEEGGKKAGTVISEAGVLKAAADEALPRITVRAESAAQTQIFGTAVITIGSGAEVPAKVMSVAVTGPALAAKGGGGGYYAIVNGTGAFNSAVRWSVSGNTHGGTAIVTGPAADNYPGTLTVDPNEGASSLTIKAVAIGDSAISHSMMVLVSGNSYVSSLAITSPSGNNIPLEPGQTLQCAAQIALAGGASGEVRWTISGHQKAGTSLSAAEGLQTALTIAPDEPPSTITLKIESVGLDNSAPPAPKTVTKVVKVMGKPAVSIVLPMDGELGADTGGWDSKPKSLVKGRDESLLLQVARGNGYDGGITWYIDGDTLNPRTGPSFRINADDPAYALGIHHIAVVGIKKGIPFSREFIFQIVP